MRILLAKFLLLVFLAVERQLRIETGEKCLIALRCVAEEMFGCV